MLLDHAREADDPGRAHLTQRRPVVAEDAGVAVVVCTDRVANADVGEHPGEDEHRVIDSGVLRIRLDPLERRLGARPLDLELGHEHDRLAARALRVDDRPLVREEDETGEVADVVLAEEDVASQPFVSNLRRGAGSGVPSSSAAGMPVTPETLAA